MKLNLPTVNAFLNCQKVEQDVINKSYELKGVFQGFNAPGYPLGAEFVTFCRLTYDEKAEFQVDVSLYDEKGTKLSDSSPRKIVFGEVACSDLVTAWRVVFPAPGAYVFKIFCNNLNLAEFKLYCH
ncbi:MAG TPA: hypothetical protein VK791_02450 [bacterium]|nr:hypothetical protein [bacterium]